MKIHRIGRVFFVATLVIATSAATIFAHAQQPGEVSGHPWIGESAPDFTLPETGGGELGLGDLKGQYIVIHFGTSW